MYRTGDMPNLVRLVDREGKTYYESLTRKEMRELGAPGELLFCARGNKQLAMYVEKVMQTNVLYHETISKKKIKLLQLTAGNGMLKQGPPYKVGVRFFHSEKI